jgi:DNA-binding CsgD family transcriptional regulator
VLKASSFGIGVFDRRLHYVGINSALAEMHGVPPPAHWGKHISHVLGDAASSIALMMERVFETGQPIKGVRLSIKLPARKEIGHWIDDYLPIIDHRGRVRNVVAVVFELKQESIDSPFHPRTEGQISLVALSPREVEIVRLLAAGKCNKEVSSILNLSVKTVESHRSRVLLKLHLDSLVGLVHYAIRTHLVEA